MESRSNSAVEVVEADNSVQLMTVLQAAPELKLSDTVARLLDEAKRTGLERLPVCEDGYLIGVVNVSQILEGSPISEAESQSFFDASISSWTRADNSALAASYTIAEAKREIASKEDTTSFVVNSEGLLLGFVRAVDLLLPPSLPVYPYPVAGMATPFGVYLIWNGFRGGVNDFALFSTGLLMGGMAVLARLIMLVLVRGSVALGVISMNTSRSVLNASDKSLASLPLYLLDLCIFLLLVKGTRLAKFHAAEHQTVHAMERHERLSPEIVARMPRVHPRCGTNIMAGGVIFGVVSQLLAPVLESELASLVAMLVAMIYWRRLGSILQRHLTTRTPGNSELQSGIAAANALIRQYHRGQQKRGRLLRFWNAGLLQCFLGMTLVLVLYVLIENNIISLLGL